MALILKYTLFFSFIIVAISIKIQTQVVVSANKLQPHKEKKHKTIGHKEKKHYFCALNSAGGRKAAFI